MSNKPINPSATAIKAQIGEVNYIVDVVTTAPAIRQHLNS